MQILYAHSCSANAYVSSWPANVPCSWVSLRVRKRVYRRRGNKAGRWYTQEGPVIANHARIVLDTYLVFSQRALPLERSINVRATSSRFIGYRVVYGKLYRTFLQTIFPSRLWSSTSSTCEINDEGESSLRVYPSTPRYLSSSARTVTFFFLVL